ncbi:MAG: Glutamate--UDP-2-acetamido-2-deoxy-D-ribohex-3-uluronic acid aminotransferase cofactor [Bryobacterales bacterium]|nr:Glutamate--UDP-2-acetamido-2-deoxy-D-ribohex-3-uluronic acid aminotransferase cofactor [Bryobacterales bacterium]
MNRRMFLGGAAAAAGAAGNTPKLAVEGGKPVRETPLKADFFGTSFYGDEESGELNDVVKTRRPFRWYGPGKEPPMKVATFEKEFAQRMQTRFALAVTSGSAALQAAIAAFEVGPGDEVILPAWTWHSCYNAIVLAGALPVFADIDESFNIDPADAERKITPQTKVIMAAHLQGNPAAMDGVLEIAKRHRLRVLEDCAQSVGASYKGRPVGSLGDIGIYSMQINKTITSGEGGALVTNDPALFERASRYHDLGGFRPLHEHLAGGAKLDWFAGNQFRMSEFTGGVLVAQLRKLDRIVASVRANARRVYDGIRDLPGIKTRYLPDPEGELGSAVFISFENKTQCERFRAAMKAENVPAGNPGGSAILPVQPHIEHKRTVHPAWPSFTSERGRSIQYGAACCARTIDILGRFAGVSLDPKFTVKDTDDIVAAIRKVYPQIARS